MTLFCNIWEGGKMDSEFDIVNKKTGETYPYFPKRRKKRHFYFMTFYKQLGDPRMALIGEMDFNNMLFVDLELLNKISHDFKIPVRTLRVHLTRMIKEKKILRIGRSKYFVNPFYYSKTNVEKINSLRLEWGQLQNKQKQPKKKDNFEAQIKKILNSK